MMRNKIFSGILVLAVAFGYWSYSRRASVSVKTVGPEVGTPAAAPAATPSPRAVPDLPANRTPANSPVPAKTATAAPRTEMQSLDSMGRTLGQIGQTSFTLKGLLEDLQKTGQEPLVVRDSNPDTGEMLIVRTKSPLPGTRYFHAQYFTGEDGERFVQHMSFEFKPGPDSMAEAVATVERNFKNLSRPVAQHADYVKWKMDDHYIVWVKKMSQQDLQDDPFNAYSAADSGTIRVAVELEIHGD